MVRREERKRKGKERRGREKCRAGKKSERDDDGSREGERKLGDKTEQGERGGR